MAEFKKAVALEDLKDGEVKGVKLDNEEIALYRVGDEVLATTDICTHEQCIISDNYYLEGEEVECTCHGSRYNIRNGENTQPPSAEPLKIYPTKIENGEVFVEV
jgi:nitrite reductase/ring-hydroxylating ferredoxin subunit